MLNGRVFLAVALIAALGACANNKSSSATASSSAANGAGLFLSNCASCHGAHGEGVPGSFPPLAANATVTGDPKRVIRIVKYGLTGKVIAVGKSYDGMMPAWSPQLPDTDIASVLTYVRSSWGNKGTPIAAADVTAVSK
ncbi:MAG TPA: cytochrome c [Candidatus Cybelea sp.]|nr:cytochrome c [Candidatus Cybelea sp.]